MNLEKIKENFYEHLKMDKYSFLKKAIDEIGNFPYIISNIYLNNEQIKSDEYQGIKINSGWNDEDEVALYISEYTNYSEDIKRIYYTYEELFSYFFIYHLNKMNEYSDMIEYVENELIFFRNYIDEKEGKTYYIDIAIEDILIRDSRRKFLLEYNKNENAYNSALIHNGISIKYSDINIEKKFFSFLLEKEKLEQFLKEKKNEFGINKKGYFFDDTFNEIFRIEFNEEIEIEYINRQISLNESENFYGENGIKYKYLNIKKDCIENIKIYENKYLRKKQNIVIIPKTDFIKEIETIVNIYEKIYNDTGIKALFKRFKESLVEEFGTL